MLKTKTFKKPLFIFLAVVLAGLLTFSPVFGQSIAELQRGIDKLNNKIDSNEQIINDLQSREDTLQNKLAILRRDIANVNAKIEKTNKEITAVESKLARTEAKLKKQRQVLKNNLKELYKSGDVSAIEALASSNNFSDFVNKQEYLESIRISVQDAAKQVEELKQSLEGKNKELKQLKMTQTSQRDRLNARRQEQNHLLAETQGQEQKYQTIVAEQRAKRERLIEEQAEAIAAATAARGGGPDYSSYSEYPFNGASMNYDDHCRYPDGSVGAEWGYCHRQCTSYVAWRLSKDGASGFIGLGHAVNWKNYGQTVSFSNAQPGDVVVWDVGFYGHVMYVESVTASGLNISQYNVPYNSGRYSTDFYTYSELRNGVNGTSFYLRRF